MGFYASQHRTRNVLSRLRTLFAQTYEYAVVTRINDPQAFSIWLGIEFALQLNKSDKVSLNPVDQIVQGSRMHSTTLKGESRKVDSAILVYLGLISYENVSGRLDSHVQFFDPCTGLKAWVTKKRSFEERV